MKQLFRLLSFCLVNLLFYSNTLFSQPKKYINVLHEGQLLGRVGSLSKSDGFGRLPEVLKSQVRTPVWDLGMNAAGVYIEFKTDADYIDVRYKVKGALNMHHMPTTGVSGVDLYTLDSKSQKWNWAFGRYSFKDTVNYSFENIGADAARTYRLYLPLYNTVEFMEIGVKSDAKFEFINNNSKPIVVYGTSIAQGACVSRPGMAWTNILGRAVKNRVINLGFSGNGKLEEPILNLMLKEDAAVFVLDCIPNLAIIKSRSEAQLDSLIQNAVQLIRAKYPTTPIILTAHSSANTAGFLNIHTMNEYGGSTKIAKATYDHLKIKGVKNLYWLSTDDIGLDVNSTVDYAHPNDYGMLKIAKAYENLLKKIL